MQIAIDKLEAHPDSANNMGERRLRKLVAHIRESGHHPPIIVRRNEGAYQILDGHQRVEALRRLGEKSARCEVWTVDDEQAAMLLLTLNRLRGKDHPRKRGTLVARLERRRTIDALAKWLPETAAKLDKLIAYTKPPPPPEVPGRTADMPHPVTFFLTTEQRRAVLKAIGGHSRDRAEGLVRALGIREGKDL